MLSANGSVLLFTPEYDVLVLLQSVIPPYPGDAVELSSKLALPTAMDTEAVAMPPDMQPATASAAAAKKQPREPDKPWVHILDPLCSLYERMELPTDRMGRGLPQLAAGKTILLSPLNSQHP